MVTVPHPIVTDITEVSGPGDLLGNLLCDCECVQTGAVTFDQIANLLNQILALKMDLD
jgi:hypothetical protein